MHTLRGQLCRRNEGNARGIGGLRQNAKSGRFTARKTSKIDDTRLWNFINIAILIVWDKVNAYKYKEWRLRNEFCQLLKQ